MFVSPHIFPPKKDSPSSTRMRGIHWQSDDGSDLGLGLKPSAPWFAASELEEESPKLERVADKKTRGDALMGQACSARLERELELAKARNKQELDALKQELEKGRAANKQEVKSLWEQVRECIKQSDSQKAKFYAEVFDSKLQGLLEKYGPTELADSVSSHWEQVREYIKQSDSQKAGVYAEDLDPKLQSLLAQDWQLSPSGSAAAVGFPDQSQDNEAALSEAIASIAAARPLRAGHNDPLLKPALKFFKALMEIDGYTIRGAGTLVDQDCSNLPPDVLKQFLEHLDKRSVDEVVPANVAFTDALKEFLIDVYDVHQAVLQGSAEVTESDNGEF